MWATGFIIVFALIFIASIIAFFIADDADVRGGSIIAAVVSAIIGVLIFVFSSAVIVPTREIGIVTTFGKPNGELSNGLHWTAPWQSVTNMDGAIQLEKFDGEHAMTVRLGNNSTANANVTIQWRLDPTSTPELFLDYRSFDNIRDNLVNKELGVALNSEFAKFDPLAPGAADGAPLVAISGKVQADVQAAVGRRVEIQKVFVPLVTYDGNTQDRINALNIEKANTRVAEQREQTAAADAKANSVLSQSVSNDPNVLVSKCLDAAARNQTSPIGCWPGSTQAGLPVVTVPVK
jgi:regulator of protease activity HflC (stomatin/prohibitin superfamily)